MAQIVTILDDSQAALAGLLGQREAREAGFSEAGCVAVGTAILEVARNIIRYAGHGTISITTIYDDGRVGVQIAAVDDGPGISDLAAALQDGYTTGGGMGCGLPGAKRLMDQFEISSQPGVGTSIIMTRWQS
jgi:serine/threonine-protein kinase RsbT